jgi:hypothetical protein
MLKLRHLKITVISNILWTCIEALMILEIVTTK